MTTLQKRLAELGACKDAIEWVGKRTLARAIADCARADWLMWLQMRMACEGVPGWSTPREVMRLMLEYAPEYEYALPITRRWAAGEDVEWADVAYFDKPRPGGVRSACVAAIRGDGHTAANEAGGYTVDRIPIATIRERLRRGRTLGRKAAA